MRKPFSPSLARLQADPATVFLAISALLAVWRISAAVTGPFQDYWWNDFRFFWMAGKLWNAGVSPYLPAYLEQGRALWTTFDAPFYYPPSIRPLVALLAAAPLKEAAVAFFSLNVAMLLFSSFLLTEIGARLAPSADRRMVLALFLAALFVVMRQPLIDACIGQFAIVLFTAAVLFLYGAAFHRPAFVAIGVAILLIKPQFGAGVLVFGLLDRSLRGPALAGALANGAFFVAGLANAPYASLSGFISNVSQYTDHPANLASQSSGLSYLMSLAGHEPPPLGTLALLAAGPVLLRLLRPKVEALTGALAILVWSIYATPSHATDFVMAAPCALLLVTGRARLQSLLLALALLTLGRSFEALRLFETESVQRLAAMTIVNTCALTVILGVSTAAALSTGRRSGGFWRIGSASASSA